MGGTADISVPEAILHGRFFYTLNFAIEYYLLINGGEYHGKDYQNF